MENQWRWVEPFPDIITSGGIQEGTDLGRMWATDSVAIHKYYLIQRIPNFHAWWIVDDLEVIGASPRHYKTWPRELNYSDATLNWVLGRQANNTPTPRSLVGIIDSLSVSAGYKY